MTRVSQLVGEGQRQRPKSQSPTAGRIDGASRRNVKTDEIIWQDSSERSNEQRNRPHQRQRLLTSSSRQINLQQQKQIGTISMQMPSMITKRHELECLSRGNKTRPDRLLPDSGRGGGGRLSGNPNRGPPLAGRRLWFGGGGRRLGGIGGSLAPNSAIGLLYQIVIVSLILHKLPALVEPSRMTMAEANPSSSSSGGMQLLDQPNDDKLHSSGGGAMNRSPNQQVRRPGNLIEMSLIYTSELAMNSDDGIDRRLQERQRQHTTSEPQQQQQQRQQQPLKLTGHQTKDVATTSSGSAHDIGRREGENNEHNRARSFMKSDTLNEGQLGGSARSGALDGARQLASATTAQPYKRSRRHAGLDDERPPIDDKLDGGGRGDSEVSAREGAKLSEAAAPDCRQLASLWLYLHSSYPMLASHLIELGMGASESQLARSIRHLLEDGERLLRSAASGIRSGQRPQTARWLARVSSHPDYGKLVQLLRARQLGDKNSHHQNGRHRIHQPARPQQSQEKSAANGQDVGAISGLAPVGVLAGAEAAADEVDGQRSGSTGQTMAPSREAYGRIVNYPHEIGSADNSNGMARTRDKLRLLKHQHQHHHQQQAVRPDGNIVELNKIPQSDSPSETGRRRLTESVINQARNNFVYGTVLLQPHGADNDEELDGNSNRRSPATTFNHNKPISTLRELAYERERQRLAQLNGRQLPPELQLETTVGGKTTGNDQSPPMSSQRSYGHILTSPPSDNRGLSGGSDKNSNSNNNNNNNHDNIDKSEQARQSEAMDELASQQSVGQAAAEEGDGDEFEGEFHASPFKQAEVRILRSLDQQQDERKPHAIELTSGELLPATPVKPIPGGAAEIVID